MRNMGIRGFRSDDRKCFIFKRRFDLRRATTFPHGGYFIEPSARYGQLTLW